MDASDLSDASFDRTDETDETDETSSPSRRLAASDERRRIVDAAIRETVRDGLDLDLPREHEHHSLSSHHRSSLSLSEPSRSSFDSDASTATNDCARASSAPFYSRKPTRPSTSSKRLSSTSSKRRPATSSKRRPATPSERLVASLETRLDSDLDARCLLARAEDEEDAADGSRSRRAKIGFARAATTSESRLPRGSTLSAHAPAFAPPTGNSVPRASCGREIRSPRFCARSFPYPARDARCGRASEASFPPPPRCSECSTACDARRTSRASPRSREEIARLSLPVCVCVCVCVFCFHPGRARG